MTLELGPDSVVVAGAGLAGSLMACFLRRRNLDVHLFERRPDPRKGNADSGRSINMALSERGITALKCIGIEDEVIDITIPMYGRKIHELGEFTFPFFACKLTGIYDFHRQMVHRNSYHTAPMERSAFDPLID